MEVVARTLTIRKENNSLYSDNPARVNWIIDFIFKMKMRRIIIMNWGFFLNFNIILRYLSNILNLTLLLLLYDIQFETYYHSLGVKQERRKTIKIQFLTFSL